MVNRSSKMLAWFIFFSGFLWISFAGMDIQWRDKHLSDFIKKFFFLKSLHLYSKLLKGVIYLELHEGEYSFKRTKLKVKMFCPVTLLIWAIMADTGVSPFVSLTSNDSPKSQNSCLWTKHRHQNLIQHYFNQFHIFCWFMWCSLPTKPSGVSHNKLYTVRMTKRSHT